MVISDLNHVEVVAETAKVKGAGDIFQGTLLGQGSNANVGGGSARNNIANLALSVPVIVNLPLGIGIL